MKLLVLARRYARALFELAQENNTLESIHSELHAFKKLLDETPELQHFFLSPEIGRQGKIEFIDSKLQDQFSTLFINFLFVLIRKGRQGIFPEIVSEFDRLYDKYHNRIRASAVTVRPLKQEELEQLRAQLVKQYKATFDIENFVDPEILGGLILKIDGRVIDASLRNQLEKLRENLLIERN